MYQTANFGNSPILPDNFKVTTKGTFPSNTHISGVTFSTTGTLLTLSTPQNSVVKVGDYVYSMSNDQVRRIKETHGNGSYTLDRAFTTDAAAEDFRYISGIPTCRGISVSVSGGASLVLNGMTYAITDAPINWYNENGTGPVAYDATGSELLFAIS